MQASSFEPAMNAKFTVHMTPLEGLVVIEPKVFSDVRGSFFESFNKVEMAHFGINDDFVQDNHSISQKGVLRGLHLQVDQPQSKLVRVIVGEVFDVAVDVRKGSSSFGSWYGVNLSARNRRMLYVPVGFAHGFLVMSAEAEVLYKTGDYYSPSRERTIAWDDPRIGIEWPSEMEPILSDKDKAGMSLVELESDLH
jgi:dTDP-4-dehydrorhamnose 3,5-epimerase